ncbi:RNA polymerase sigma factor (sigma-70 family) [Mobilisporobacter senegalensis]|uniref:RNA polymerase sigma factor (Sigma-70 family) n=1 Tax=Mobilisporobacter senegalensis TaxID=1329262 RepID=A0A3N1XN54_9FIRM|nr:sigma-70 family RNA polymerase sigma factor [Mobilisporobacter senegalensis]ROR28130.1 RNA polymerase sigma factor (sigma-70 family) [Mobilisporobacter senegalensis]
MSREYKTSKKKRTNYIYYTAEGTKIVIVPGEDGVTEADIELLHSIDDCEVDEQRRYHYRVTTHLDAYHDGENEAANDRNKYLADESVNPEQILLEEENEDEHQELLSKLARAMEWLTLEEKELFKKKYVDNRTNVDMASEMGVSETTIRKRLKKLQGKIRKLISADV